MYDLEVMLLGQANREAGLDRSGAKHIPSPAYILMALRAADAAKSIRRQDTNEGLRCPKRPVVVPRSTSR
jgi:hypothetical protein